MATELENERRVIDWLGGIAVAALVGVVAVVVTTAGKPTGLDTATLVALIGVATAAVTALGVRRTRTGPEPTAPPNSGTPPLSASLTSGTAPPAAPFNAGVAPPYVP